jgi:hypothetical protein
MGWDEVHKISFWVVVGMVVVLGSIFFALGFSAYSVFH